MKIGISSPYLNTLGGGERYILTAASCLSYDHNVSILWDDNDIKEKAQNRLSINLKKVKIKKDFFYHGKNLIYKYRESKKFDLIVFLSDGSIPLSFAKRNIIHFQMPFTKINGRSLTNLIKLKKINKIICNSQFTKEFIDKEFGVDSEVLYPPVPVNRYKPGRKTKIILSVGRFHPLKKQEVLIEVFKKISRKLRGWKLVLAGGLLEQDREYFNKLIKKSKGLKIEVLPNLDFEQLKVLYGKAKIYWHAAGFTENENKNPRRMEHFGITTVEAMAAGCVPIAFRGGGQKEIINHTDNGFLWETEKDLIKYTIEVVKNTSFRRKIIIQAMENSKQYSVKRYCEQINKIVDNL